MAKRLDFRSKLIKIIDSVLRHPVIFAFCFHDSGFYLKKVTKSRYGAGALFL